VFVLAAPQNAIDSFREIAMTSLLHFCCIVLFPFFSVAHLGRVWIQTTQPVLVAVMMMILLTVAALAAFNIKLARHNLNRARNQCKLQANAVPSPHVRTFFQEGVEELLNTKLQISLTFQMMNRRITLATVAALPLLMTKPLPCHTGTATCPILCGWNTNSV
jgi:hypothetical protein